MGKISLKILAKSPSRKNGFTMFEVLISILISSAFIMGTLQAMVINAFLQVKAERQARATFWIQEDLEYVKSVAAELTPDNQDGYGDKLDDLAKKCKATTFTYDSTNATNSYGDTLRYLIDNPTIAQTNPVVLTGMTNTTATTPILQVGGNRSLVNRSYRLVRQIITSGSPEVLKITYIVGEPDDTSSTKVSTNSQKILARLYAEVIPTGSFKCQ